MGGANGKVAYIGTTYNTAKPSEYLADARTITQTLKGPSDPRGIRLFFSLTHRSLLIVTG